jgi:hypothetical protein
LLSRGMAVVIVIAASGFSYKHANIFPTWYFPEFFL